MPAPNGYFFNTLPIITITPFAQIVNLTFSATNSYSCHPLLPWIAIILNSYAPGICYFNPFLGYFLHSVVPPQAVVRLIVSVSLKEQLAGAAWVKKKSAAGGSLIGAVFCMVLSESRIVPLFRGVH